MTSRKKRSVALGFETLESRQLMANNITAGLVDGELQIQGTNLADEISVLQTTSTLTVTGKNSLGTQTWKFNPAQIERILIDGRAGNDTLDLGFFTTIHGVLNGGAGGDYLYGGAVADLIFGEDGNDFLDGRGGSDLLDGEAGDDTLVGADGNDRLFGDGDVDADRVVSADITGDGRTDLVFLVQDPNLGLIARSKIARGDGTFATRVQILTDGPRWLDKPVLVGDFNNDGRADLLFMYQDPVEGLMIRTRLSNGDGTFVTRKQTLADGSALTAKPVLVGDFDGQAGSDLVFMHQDSDKGLLLRTRLSNGDGTFNTVKQTLGDGKALTAKPVLVGDFNGDNLSDLVFMEQHSVLGLLLRTRLSDGDGTFTTRKHALGFGPDLTDKPVLVGDFNNDNLSDLVFMEQDPVEGLKLRTRLSNSDGSFTVIKHTLGLGPQWTAAPVLVGNFDGNDRLDKGSDLVFMHHDPVTGLQLRTRLSNGDGTFRLRFACTRQRL